MTAPDLAMADVATLDPRLNAASPADIIRAALDAVGRDQLALVSAFGNVTADEFEGAVCRREVAATPFDRVGLCLGRMHAVLKP